MQSSRLGAQQHVELKGTQGLKIGDCHEGWLCKRRLFISMTNFHSSPSAFLDACKDLTKSSYSKSSHQSDVGTNTGRSKLGAERLSDKLPKLRFRDRVFNHFVGLAKLPSIQRGWFGNPCVRVVFKLCASIMKIMHKVKSSSSIEVLSPTLLLLEDTGS